MTLLVESSFHLLGDNLPLDRVVSRFTLEERLSDPYRCEVEFSTQDSSFRAFELLNQSLALRIEDDLDNHRFVHGVVSQIEMSRVVGKRIHFLLVLRPALWLLSQRMDCRIFQKQSAVEIVTALLKESGLDTGSNWNITTSCPTREFVIQYRESTLNFIQRLLEDEGISYYFRHSEEGHILHFVDTLFADNQDAAVALGFTPGVLDKIAPLRSLNRRKRLRVSEVTLRDFDVNNPEVHPEARKPTEKPTPQVLFNYGQLHGGPMSAEHYAKAALRAQRYDSDVIVGHTNICHLGPAMHMEIDGVEEMQLSGIYYTTDITCEGVRHKEKSTETGKKSTICTCDVRFGAIPQDALYVPPRRARRPRISGVQTALVVGDSDGDQSIDVDSLGRVLVHFHWDRLQAADKNASCRIRVNQLPLGGSMILPRVGWEVLVAFENGDPDRPLVLGRTYNAENMPPLSLPDNKASASLSSMSSPGGAGSNKISLGDSGGSQGFSIKAQKDFNATTGFNLTEDVTLNDEHQVNANLNQSVGINQSLEVGADQSETYGASLTIKVTGNQTRSVGINENANATANLLEKVQANKTTDISANHMLLCNGERMTVDGNFTRTVGIAEMECTAASMSDNLVGAYSTTVGAIRAHLTGGSHGEVVGGAKTETTMAGAVHISSADTSIEAQGASAQLIGAAVKRKVTGDLTIKAPLITIVGAKGKFQAGGGMMDLAGGPIKLKGGSIVIKAAVTKISSGSLKLG